MAGDPHAWHGGVATHDTAGASAASMPRGANPGKLTPVHLKHKAKIGGAMAQVKKRIHNIVKASIAPVGNVAPEIGGGTGGSLETGGTQGA